MDTKYFYHTLRKNAVKNSGEPVVFCCINFKIVYFQQFLCSESAIWCPFFISPSPLTYFVLKFKKKKQSPHNFDSFEALKSLSCSKIGFHFFSPFPNLLEIWFQKIIFFTSEKNIWCPFILSPIPFKPTWY